MARDRKLVDITWDVHSWVGASVAIAAFVFFFGGIFALHREALHAWERPSERAVFRGLPASVDALVRPVLARHDLRGKDVHIELPSQSEPFLELRWNEDEALWIDPGTGRELATRETSHAVDTLYELHCLEQIPHDIGLGISGLVGLLAVVLVITGIVVHVRMRKELFQFRPRASVRAAWTDAHKVLGTFGIPFGLVAGFTGALIGLGHLYFHAVVAWGGGIEVFSADMRPAIPAIQASAPGDYPFRVDDALAVARDRWPSAEVDQIVVMNAGEPGSTTTVTSRDPRVLVGGAEAFGDALLVFETSTGRELSRTEPAAAYNATTTLWQLMVKLHYGRYGTGATKLFYSLLGIAFCLSIATGMVLWLETRRRRFPTHVSRYRRIDQLRIGIMVGLLPATAAVFLTNRVVPADAPRSLLEQGAFFAVWLCAALYPLVRHERASRDLFALAGLLCLLLPVANGISTGDWPWHAAATGLSSVFWVDIAAIIAGAVCMVVAHAAHRRPLVWVRHE